MFDGVFCRDKDFTELYEYVLIDEFNKCIDSASNVQFNRSSSSMEPSLVKPSSEATPETGKKWCVGMNVQAIYDEDQKYYEAIITEIIDDNAAIVRFIGYDNEQIVDLEILRDSEGPKTQMEQMKQAELDNVLYVEDEVVDCSGSLNEIDWKKGMACRALYDKNDTIYEATVLEVDENERTAVLIMTGYDIRFNTTFDNMFESIPEYRIKQKNSAKKYVCKKTIEMDTSNHLKTLNLDSSSGQKESVTSNSKIEKESSVVSNKSRSAFHSQINHPPDEHDNLPIETHLPVSCSAINILQPENESEALACLISANYLSGYYAASEMFDGNLHI